MDASSPSSNTSRPQSDHSPASKRARPTNSTDSVAHQNNAKSPSPSAATIDALPAVALKHIGTFVEGGSLSGACTGTLEAIRELHYKINMWHNASSFGMVKDPSGSRLRRHMGLQPSGALATGRVVTQITITGCCTKGYDEGGRLVKVAVQRVIRHSVPTLQSITIKGAAPGADSPYVSAILGELVPRSAKRYRVAPVLTRVKICDDSNAVTMAGKAIAAGLWPELQELLLPHCHAHAGQFKFLANAITDGRVPNLRVLNWDDQTCHRRKAVDDPILFALATGKCPHIERLSFTGNTFCPEFGIFYLQAALRACPNLRELRMDCSRSPRAEVEVLTRVLKKGYVPRLEFLSIRSSKPFREIGTQIRAELAALEAEAARRVPRVHFVPDIKTSYRPSNNNIHLDS